MDGKSIYTKRVPTKEQDSFRRKNVGVQIDIFTYPSVSISF